VAFGLSGNHTGFLDEFEVALKSILLNAPLENDMTIHLLADQEAFHSIHTLLSATGVRTWTMRTQISIIFYNVEPLLEGWQHQIENGLATALKYATRSLWRHTLGNYFGLFAVTVLPDDVQHVLYLDTDVVIMASLDDLFLRHADSSVSFQWGRERCAGFLLLNLPKFSRVWELYARIKESTIKKIMSTRAIASDQHILQAINMTFPEEVGILSPAWDTSWMDGPWKRTRGTTVLQNTGETILEHRAEGVGMLHFNGGGSNQEAYFKEHNAFQNQKLTSTWGLAKYYAEVPWTWAKFIAASRIVKKGYEVIVCNAVI
jgi:hypothetical protein